VQAISTKLPTTGTIVSALPVDFSNIHGLLFLGCGNCR
jgi:hypothetical protein